MISATKKSRTNKRLSTIISLSGRGVVGDISGATEERTAARPKNKRTTGDGGSVPEPRDAGRALHKRRMGEAVPVTDLTPSHPAKSKTREDVGDTNKPVARRGGERASDTVRRGAATNKSRSDDPTRGTEWPNVAPAPSNGTADAACHDADVPLVSRAKSKRRGGEKTSDTEMTIATPAKPKRGRGAYALATDACCAASAETNGHAKDPMSPKRTLRVPAGGGDQGHDTDTKFASACLELQELQRQAVYAQKCRIRAGNSMTMCVAMAIGYRGGLEEDERKRLWGVACKILKGMQDGTEIPEEYQHVVNNVRVLVLNIQLGAQGFEKYEKSLNKKMESIVKSLPIAEWIKDENQRGIGEVSVARIIGETGDLSNYAGPAKVWKRMGLAPYKGKMPSTWRSSKPSLHAAEWTELGYCPRRRSVVWNIEQAILKGNHGTYRKRYDDAKERFKVTHEGCKDGHAHNHALLLCGKEFIKQLWKAWNKA